jgi:hypothetical protein
MSQYERAMELDEEDIDHILESEEDFPGFAKVLSILEKSCLFYAPLVLSFWGIFYSLRNITTYIQESAPAGAAYFPQGY